MIDKVREIVDSFEEMRESLLSTADEIETKSGVKMTNMRYQIQTNFDNFKRSAFGYGGWNPNLLSQALEFAVRGETIKLKSDISRAIGYCRGLGHPDKYLEKQYPELLSEEQT